MALSKMRQKASASAGALTFLFRSVARAALETVCYKPPRLSCSKFVCTVRDGLHHHFSKEREAWGFFFLRASASAGTFLSQVAKLEQTPYRGMLW